VPLQELLRKEKEHHQGIKRSSGKADVDSGDVQAAAEVGRSDQCALANSVACLDPEETKRRLRVLKEPATLFGETAKERSWRLAQAELNVQVEDEAAGGQRSNLHIEIERERRELSRVHRLKAMEAGKSSTTAATLRASFAPVVDEENTQIHPANKEEQQLMVSFQAAAEAIGEKNMAVEDRISKWLKRWMNDWEEDLETRASDVKTLAAGRQADVRFKETQEYMRPLYSRLRNRSLDPQLLAGIKLIVDAIKERNYLHAYKIYMGVAVGNSPWPIGVTQVGLHERSAREKISFKYASGSAHIMNDEATRKFIQALKRLMTFCQRRYPTDPSRSVDFDGFTHEGRGAAGAGSDKAALLLATSRGETVAPAPAPSYLDATGAVKIPESWDKVLRGALQEVTASDAAEEVPSDQ